MGGPGSSPEPIRAVEGRPTRVDRLVAVIRDEIPAGELTADLAAIEDAVAIMTTAYRSSASGSWETVG
jgi:hypothetical protein